jgi:hypothetical protein
MFMNHLKPFLKKVLLGTVLIALAAVVTVFLKETLDTQDPESALPIITVEYNGLALPDVYRAGYEWSFFATVERRTPQLSEADIPLVPADVLPAAPIRITFSKEPSVLTIKRAAGRYSTDFLEITDVQDGTFRTPTVAGIYVYKVYAEWYGRGNIQYYFALQVPQL